MFPRPGMFDNHCALQTVPPHRLDSLRAKWPDELHIDTYLGVYFYRLNTKPPKSHPKDQPWPLADRDVRRALALAINRKDLIDHVLKAGQPSGASAAIKSKSRFVYSSRSGEVQSGT